ncbi:unnamed protein product [Citrullus colocynthis]|uniref:Uncharacterized protein n=1 Tax=Citrullus colocynthis TaxID=252529 RepID=A0ABP0XS30_9ROSI
MEPTLNIPFFYFILPASTPAFLNHRPTLLHLTNDQGRRRRRSHQQRLGRSACYSRDKGYSATASLLDATIKLRPWRRQLHSKGALEI